jgi:O-acetylserine/cysteine efflux transporter
MQRRDILLGLIVVTVWGLNFIAIKLGLRDVPPLLLGALRFLLASVPAIFFLKRPPVPWPWLIALGMFLNVGQFTFLFGGMKVGMPAGLASLVLQSQAFFTLFVAVTWFGEHWRWNHLAGLTLAACGMTVIGFQQGGGMTTAGFVMTLLAAASWGVGNVIMRRATVGVPAFSMLSLVVWAGAVAIIPLTILSLLLEGYGAWVSTFQTPSWTSLGSLIYLSFFATLVGYGLWGKLMSRYPAAVVSPLALMVPVVGLSSSTLFLGEALSVWQGLGAVLIMTGLVIHVLGGKLGFRNCEVEDAN